MPSSERLDDDSMPTNAPGEDSQKTMLLSHRCSNRIITGQLLLDRERHWMIRNDP